MSNSKVKMEVVFDINEEMLLEHGLTAEKVLDNIYMDDDDVRDGFQIGTIIEGFDNTSDFFLENGAVVSKEIVSPERDKGVERYPKLSNTRDGELIKSKLNNQGLRIIEDILEAYSKDKIDVEVVRDENDQIEFDKSGNLIVKDKSYEETGFESLVIKWYEDMEDTGYLVECFDDYARDESFDKAIRLVDEVCSQKNGNEVFWKACVIYMLKAEDVLSDDELLIMADRIYEAQYCSTAPFLTAERADAAVYLMAYGVTEKRFPGWPVMTPEQAKEFLLTCDYDVFLDFIDAVVEDDRTYYQPDGFEAERVKALDDALFGFVAKKPALDSVISDADSQKSDKSVASVEKDIDGR